jgi:orotidine-5'-phosphate decarboxylase
MIKDSEGKMLYQNVLEKVQTYGKNIMFVVGATRAEALKEIRKIAPDNFLLVPGVGAQGGSLEEVAEYGMNSNCGLLVNSSRGIIYASSSEDFAQVARQKALDLQTKMSVMLKKASLIQ